MLFNHSKNATKKNNKKDRIENKKVLGHQLLNPLIFEAKQTLKARKISTK